MMATFTVLLLLVLLFAGVPVALALIGSSLAAVFIFASDLAPSIPLSVMSTSSNYLLLAIPLFIMAGEIAIKGKLIEPLVDLTRALLAPVPGGTGAATVLTCMFFAGITGSTAAEAAAVGSFGLPVMRKAGYPLAFSTAIIACASTFGILIPPSLTMVLFGSITQTPVGPLFMAGLVPGLVLGLALMVLVGFLGWRGGFGQRQKLDFKLISSALVQSVWVIAMPILVVIGIYSGLFTPTEVAAVIVAYGLSVAVLVYRAMGWADWIEVCRATVRISCMLYLILIGASLFAFVMTAEGVPQHVVEMVTQMDLTPLQFLMILNGILLALGCFLDGLSMLVITLPLIFPISTALGIDPLHLAVLMTVNIEMGVLLPPVGINLYVLSGISGLKIDQIVKALLPFYAFLLSGLMLMTYVPAFSTWLPSMLR
jgi:C4-dicarboxylate transporter DctM subunit